MNDRQKTKHLMDALRGRYVHDAPRPAGQGEPRYVFIPELKLSTGFAGTWTPPNGDQRIDAWVLDTWPSSGFTKLAFEVKVSRADWKRELDHPEKRRAAFEVSNFYYFVTPTELVQPSEVPEECGLYWVDVAGRLRFKKKAERRPCESLSMGFVAMILRRGMKEVV